MAVTAVTLVVIPAVLLAAVLLLVLVPMVSVSTLNWFGVAITLGVVSAATIVAVLCGVVQAVVGIQFIVLVSKSSRTIKTKGGKMSLFMHLGALAWRPEGSAAT